MAFHVTWGDPKCPRVFSPIGLTAELTALQERSTRLKDEEIEAVRQRRPLFTIPAQQPQSRLEADMTRSLVKKAMKLHIGGIQTNWRLAVDCLNAMILEFPYRGPGAKTDEAVYILAYRTLKDSIRFGHLDCLLTLVSSDWVNELLSSDVSNVICLAAANGNVAGMGILLILSQFRKIDLFELGRALILAAGCGHQACLEILLDSEKALEISSFNLGFAFAQAVANHHPDCFGVLLNSQRFVQSSDKDLLTFLCSAIATVEKLWSLHQDRCAKIVADDPGLGVRDFP